MSFAAGGTQSAGGTVPIDRGTPEQDWNEAPVKKESNFANWVDKLPASNNVEDRRPLEEGTIAEDELKVRARNPVKNDDGTYSTIRSITINEDGKEVLIPTVHNGKILSNEEAIKVYQQTGKHLGKFRTSEDAHQFGLHISNEMASKFRSGEYSTPDKIGENAKPRSKMITPLPRPRPTLAGK